MIFKRLNRTAAESVFGVFKANEAGISANDPVALSVQGGAAAPDGVGIEQPTGSAGQAVNAFVGIADAAIGNGSYGLVQTYGYRSGATVLQQLSTIAAGVALYPVSDQDFLATGAAQIAVAPVVTLLESAATSASTGTTTLKVFIRCM